MVRTVMISALVTLGALALALAVARLAFALPEDGRGAASRAIPASADTALGRAVARRPDESAIHPLEDGRDAFAARLLLVRAAEASIDAQYYIWHDDLTGLMLLEALREAADRGVRVRLLLDDNGIAGLDEELAGLMAHDNVEVRLFNPFALRRPKWANYLFDPLRLNRRMHNKSFTVDGAVTVVGGRNVGDEYFAAGTAGDYFDLDVMAAGAVVGEVAAQFDAYWASGPVHDAAAIVGPGAAAALDEGVRAARADPRHEAYREAVRRTGFVAAFVDGTLEMEPVAIALVADDPAKGMGEASRKGLLVGQLDALLGRPEAHVELVSAYFVPGRRGTEALAEMAARGVRVRVLTNSLDATDVVPVHAGYAKRRRALLEAGVELYELKRGEAGAERDDPGPVGSSAASLHAKTFGVDGERVFVGSFNFDPRSVHLNTEMGFLIESGRLARTLFGRFDDGLALGSYRVRLDADGGLTWIETAADGSEIRHATEPGSTWSKRLAVAVVGWLPVEWLL